MKSLIVGLIVLAVGLVSCSRRNPASEIEAQVIKSVAFRDGRWTEAKGAAMKPPPPFVANLDFVDSPQYEGKSVDEVIAMLPKSYTYTFVFVADEQTLEGKNHPFWCVDLLDERNPRFRVEARHLASVANNLALANMDFAEFAEAAKKNGVFSGF